MGRVLTRLLWLFLLHSALLRLNFTVTELEAKTVKQLQGLLRQRGLKISGRKKDLVCRLSSTNGEVSAGHEPLEDEDPTDHLDRCRHLRARVAEQGIPEDEEVKRRLESYQQDFPEIYAQLRPQQKENIQRGLLQRGRCLIADEMGLGKTFTSLVLSQIYAKEWPLLVVAPTSVTENWVNQVRKWLPHLANDVQVLNGRFLRRHDVHKIWVEKLIFVTSYDMLRIHPQLRRQADGSPYKVVIMDEAHKIKNPLALRTEALLPVCRAANRCFLLSGTPVLNSAAETWPLMAAPRLDVNMPSFESFCEHFCDWKLKEEADGSVKRVPYGATNPEELHTIFTSYMVRSKKKDVLPNLASTRKWKKDLRDKVQGKYAQQIMVIMKQSQKNLVSKIFSITAKAKAAPVTDFVEDFLLQKGSSKLVIFGHHYVIFDRMEKMLTRLNKRYVRLDGTVPQNMRQARIDKFQQEPDYEVALVGMKACGQGISLTAADTVIFAELTWTPATLQQAEARVHRPGLEHGVEIIYPVLSGFPFMDDTVIRKLQDKERIADLITDGEELEQSRFATLL